VKRRKAWLGGVLLSSACGFLDDRPSQGAARKAHGLIRPGLTVAEVVTLTEPLAERSVWVLSAEGCPPAAGFTVRLAQRGDSGYLLISGRPDDPAGAVRRLPTRDGLAAALSEEPLRACRELELGLGQWSVPFRVDGSGRVEAVSLPRFTD
jgi:hypothetical protein